MICPGDKFLLSQLKLAKTFIITKAEICCTWSGNWSEAAEDKAITKTHVTTTKIKSKVSFFSFPQPTHDEMTSAFLPSHRVFDAGPQGLRGAGVIILLIVSPHFTHGPEWLTTLSALHIFPPLCLYCAAGGLSVTEFSSAGAGASRWEEDGGDSRPRQGRMR